MEGFLNGHGNRQEQVAKAFNEGSDARLKGLSALHNPYHTDLVLGNWWLRGWEDVQSHYGAWVKGKWKVRPLPRVA